KCIAINKGFFKQEVLGRTGPPHAFAAKSMRSFIEQLSLYGFITMQWDFQWSASLPEFFAGEAMASLHRKLLYCYSPRYNSKHPHLLERWKRR
ncbi:HSFY1 protein, partial [Calyptomena viridis]|nr:HSFY1 protein [Calyptomena viridis]